VSGDSSVVFLKELAEESTAPPIDNGDTLVASVGRNAEKACCEGGGI